MTQNLSIPVIGIGAGAATDGQVLVIYDLLGMNDDPPRFVKNFLVDGRDILQALQAYVKEVREGLFPNAEQSYS